jgi:hypothetical protein
MTYKFETLLAALSLGLCHLLAHSILQPCRGLLRTLAVWSKQTLMADLNLRQVNIHCIIQPKVDIATDIILCTACFSSKGELTYTQKYFTSQEVLRFCPNSKVFTIQLTF